MEPYGGGSDQEEGLNNEDEIMEGEDDTNNLQRWFKLMGVNIVKDSPRRKTE